MWFKESKRYFCKIENFAYREINESPSDDADTAVIHKGTFELLDIYRKG